MYWLSYVFNIINNEILTKYFLIHSYYLKAKIVQLINYNDNLFFNKKIIYFVKKIFYFYLK